MKESLQPGLETTRRWEIGADRCIGFMGDDLRVYGTPFFTGDMEHTCRDMILDHLDDGEDSVGTRVELDHSAPTLIGMWVDISVTVAKVEGRRVTFDFSARDEMEEIGKGRHVRFVVDKAKTGERLAVKRAQLKDT
jgi:predicted thioesterase